MHLCVSFLIFCIAASIKKNVSLPGYQLIENNDFNSASSQTIPEDDPLFREYDPSFYKNNLDTKGIQELQVSYDTNVIHISSMIGGLYPFTLLGGRIVGWAYKTNPLKRVGYFLLINFKKFLIFSRPHLREKVQAPAA